MDKKVYFGIGVLSLISVFLVSFLIYKIGRWQIPAGNSGQPTATFSAEVKDNLAEASPSAVTANLTIAYGILDQKAEKIATYSATLTTPATVFDLINKVSESNKLDVEYEKQTLGDFVKSIEGVTNRREYLWLFYYNRRPAITSIDKQALKEGDSIELHYDQIP